VNEHTARRTWSAAVWVLIVLAIGVVLGAGLALTVHVPQNPGPPGPPGPAPPPVAIAQSGVLLSVVSLVLLSALIVVYGRNYRTTGAPYVLGLLLFLVVLFFETALNSPLLFTAFGRGPGNLGPFLAVSELLMSAALSIFLYLSLQ
jgi:hypothetical protein